VTPQGILPSILAALVSARSRTRAALAELPGGSAAARAVLDSRQRALKVVANALYGFTGKSQLNWFDVIRFKTIMFDVCAWCSGGGQRAVRAHR